MRNRLASRAAALVLLVCLQACGESSQSASSTLLAATDSVILAESEQIFVARTAAFHPAEDGAFAVSDAARSTVLEYSRTGELQREYGHRGRGPGEFGRIGTTVLLSATHLFANDGARKVLLVFERGTGRLVTEIPYAGRLGDSRLDGAGVVFGLWDIAREKAGVVIAVDSLPLRGVGDSLVARLTSIPSHYVSSGALAGMFGLYVATSWGDSAAAVFAGDSTIVLQSLRSQPERTLTVPAQQRRGLPSDLAQRLESSTVPFADKVNSASAALHIGRLSSGDFAIVHYDSYVVGSDIRARLWLTLISSAGQARCIDREIPTSGDVRALVHIVRDTLFVLDQTVADSNLTTLVRMIPISAKGC